MAARKAGEHANGNPQEHAHRPRKRGDQATPHEDGPESHGAPESAEPRAEGPAAASADGQPAEESTVNRAEEIVDQVAARVAQWTSSFGRTLLRLGARAREEAEDMWAEAQHIRHGSRS